MEGFKRQPLDTQNVLLQLNIADDYFKAKKQVELLEGQLSDKEKELYDIKHELIATQIKLENTEKNVKNLQSDITEDSRKIIQMETELKTLKK
jgi:cell division protein ZapA